jgi:hypothetical protein
VRGRHQFRTFVARNSGLFLDTPNASTANGVVRWFALV